MGNRVGSCGRTAAEIRYIQASLELFAQLPPERREVVRATIARVAATPEEGMALFRLVVQKKALSAVAEATGLSLRRLARLRLDFFKQMPL